MAIKFSSSVLLVKDIALAREFYEGLLEQTVTLDHGECLAFAGGFALWQADYARKVMQLPAEKAIDEKMQHCFELYFEVDDLEDILKKLREANFELVHEIMEQPWGQRVLRVYDPDGHIIELGTF